MLTVSKNVEVYELSVNLMSNKPVIQVASMNSVIEDLVFISHYLFKSTHTHYNKEIPTVDASMNIEDKNQCFNLVLF